MNPQFGFIFTKEEDRPYLQASRQEKLEIFAEDYNKFFLKVNDARIEFVKEAGKITKAILKQGGRTTEAMKVKYGKCICLLLYLGFVVHYVEIDLQWQVYRFGVGELRVLCRLHNNLILHNQDYPLG